MVRGRLIAASLAAALVTACGLDVTDPDRSEVASVWSLQGSDDALMVIVESNGAVITNLRCVEGSDHLYGGEWESVEGLEGEARLRFSAFPRYDRETGRFCGPGGERPEAGEWDVLLERRWPSGALRLVFDRGRGGYFIRVLE